MGQSRRHGDLFDELGRQRIEEIALRPTPVSLSAEELDADAHPVKSAGEGAGIRVRAWVRYPETVVDVAAEAFEWNDKAVHVRWTAPDGSRRQAWVWANAVRRVEPPLTPRDRDVSAHFSGARRAQQNPPEVGGRR
jgi:hypothetical protein